MRVSRRDKFLFPLKKEEPVSECGLTLIELLVIVTIVSILSAIAVIKLFEALENAKVSRCVTDIKLIREVALTFYADTGRLPCSKAGGWGEDPGFVRPITPFNCWPDEGGCEPECVNVPRWNGPYLQRWPTSPWYSSNSGVYHWDLWLNFTPRGTNKTCSPGGMITLRVYRAVSLRALKKIDAFFDDGDLSQGFVFGEAGTQGTPENPQYIRILVVCE